METPRQNVRTHKYSSVKAQGRDGGMHLGRFAQTACFEGYFLSIQSSYPCTPQRSPVSHTFSSQIIVHLPKQLVIYWELFSAVDRYPFGALVSRTVLCVGIIQNKLHSHTCDALQQSILIVFYGTEEYQTLATRTILGSIDLKTRGRIHSPLLTLLVPAAVLLLLF